MCGIVAVLARPSSRPAPDPAEVLSGIERARSLLGAGSVRGGDVPALVAAAGALREVDVSLRYTPGLRTLLSQPDLVDAAARAAATIGSRIKELEDEFDRGSVALEPDAQEQVNSALVALKDAWWSISADRLGAARSVADLLEGVSGVPENLDGWWSIQVALSAIDRLEVRGRDSAGIQVLVTGHGLDLHDPDVRAGLEPRLADPLFTSGAVRVSGEAVAFVYKAAAEIGELGDNVKAIRAEIRADGLLAAAIGRPGARTTVLGHTRWASVGIISQPNAHPVNSEELERPSSPYVAAVLNGDVDNHAELRLTDSLHVAPEVTTDAKVIPVLVSRAISSGCDIDSGFRSTVQRFDGSVAIAASAAAEPDSLHLALCGSGQSLYVGLAEEAFVVASEPYGLVEETDRYVRMDGETTRGQVLALDRSNAGRIEGMRRFRYDGAELPVSAADVTVAEITTRDVDRGGFQHFLLKELTEAPGSFRKTLRGRIVTGSDGKLSVRLGIETVPASLSEALAAGTIARILVIGQGTAAVAGQAVAAAIARCLPGMPVSALPATELSGFGMQDDMSDTVVIAISQSGTTTDTNRTVDLVRTRGAHVVCVVNRRNSDLVSKSHGVLYTSDGRDVEMSVASTKAFYAQVAAGWLLAGAFAQACAASADVTAVSSGELAEVLASLRELPEAMERVLSSREEIGRIAAAVAPSRRYWAVVGSGPDRIAASEVRIKLSELCYRSISSDATEDKKHIDLSCEPMILVCAAGLRGSNADDVAKEVAIYRAHKAAPVVVAASGEADRFASSALDIITVPKVDQNLSFVLAAMAGHVFGYEAALSIDGQARPLRAARAAIEKALENTLPGQEDRLLERLAPEMEQAIQPFLRGLRDSSYNGNLEASTAVRLVSLLRYATGLLPLEGYELETGKIGTPEALVSDLIDALNAGVDELTRPVDAIKHQAKTVTVGISRSEDALFGVPLVKATLSAGAAADTLGYRALRTLSALDEAVQEVLGYTRYRIEWSVPGRPSAVVIDQGGIARNLPSRTASNPLLRGTKHRAAEEKEVTVARGASDGRTVILIPEVKGAQVTGMTLLHVRFHEVLGAEAAKRVLSGYRTRYSALSDAVTETEPAFDDSRLGQEPIVDLLTEPVYALAARWRSR